MSTKSHSTDIARRALASIPSNDLLDLVDQLDLRPTPGSSPILLVPLRSLKQRRDVETFLRNVPLATASLLLEIIGHDVLGAIIEQLGEHASEPTFDQLADVVDGILSEGASAVEVRAVLGHVVAEGFPAAVHCEKLLAEREQLAIPESL